MHFKYLFIGGGIATISAVIALRKSSVDSIGIINNESFLPYKRTQLSKKLKDKEIENEFALLDSAWYNHNNVHLINNEAGDVDIKSKLVLMLDGENVGFDTLILSTGLHAVVPVIPGLNPHHICVLRNIHQANVLIKKLATKTRVAVIGGGVEGLEIAWQCHKLGKSVAVFERGANLMERNFSSYYATRLQRVIESKGVEVFTNSIIEKGFHTDKDTFVLSTQDKEYEFDLVVAAVGALPNISLAHSCGAEVNQGIVVNEFFQTTNPAVYAIGDVVDIPNHKNCHLWHQAEYMGTLLAATLLGTPRPFVYKPFRLKAEVFDTYLFSLNREVHNNDECVTFLQAKGDKQRTFYFVDKELCGVEMINDGDNAKLYQQAVWEKWSIEQIKTLISWE